MKHFAIFYYSANDEILTNEGEETNSGASLILNLFANNARRRKVCDTIRETKAAYIVICENNNGQLDEIARFASALF